MGNFVISAQMVYYYFLICNVGLFIFEGSVLAQKLRDMTTTSPPLLPQFRPPVASATTSKRRLKPPRRLAHVSAGGARRIAPAHVVARCRTRNGSRTTSSDDYHATLRALNSKGRFPRKSLGQVFPTLFLISLSLSLCMCVFSEKKMTENKISFFFFFHFGWVPSECEKYKMWVWSKPILVTLFSLTFG